MEKLKSEDRRLVSRSDLCKYTGLGANKAVEFAKSVGADIKIGRRRLFDLQTIDNAINAKLAGNIEEVK